ncbi:MAG: hypothetical protein Q8T04_12555 [Bacteroidota bacterium]|nr:hypothetical protein [Bacteroidota bacterium]
MKTKIGILVLALSTSFFSLQAQRTVTTTRAASYDISDNLDLDAVASIFGDSENLEDFERRLNDPDNRISNLDLNEDGYIDYLRVLENSSDRNSLVVVQAVLDKDVYQDVATIEIERVQNGNPRVQIVGDSYIYGSNYIIEPVYVRTPLIFSFFWSPRYITYHSPYYWDYYPSWYSYYRPYSPFRYQRNVYVHINRYNTYHRSSTRNIYFSGDNYNRIRRSDYASRNPNRNFESRNAGVKNRYELDQRRPNNQANRQRSNDVERSTNRQYQNNSRVSSGSNERQRNVNENRRPDSNVQPGSNQTRTRDNSNVKSTQQRSGSSGDPVQIKSANKNDGSSVSRSQSAPTQNRSANQVKSNKQKTDSRSQSISKPTPNRSQNRVESPQRSSAPREKSGSVSGQSRSNTQVKQAQPSQRKSESPKNENKKESGNNRRR